MSGAKRKDEVLSHKPKRDRQEWRRAKQWFDGETLDETKELLGDKVLVGPTCSGRPEHSEWYGEERVVIQGLAPKNPWWAGKRGLETRDVVRMREFAIRVVLKGQAISKAGAAVGWTRAKAAYTAREGKTFAKIRGELLQEHDVGLEGMVEEIKSVEFDTAHQGALKRNEIVYESKDEILVAKVAADALDRIGLRAPTKVDQTFHVELDGESRELLAKMTGAMAILPRSVRESEFAYAQRTAKQLLIETNETDRVRSEIETPGPPHGGD